MRWVLDCVMFYAFFPLYYIVCASNWARWYCLLMLVIHFYALCTTNQRRAKCCTQAWLYGDLRFFHRHSFVYKVILRLLLHICAPDEMRALHLGTHCQRGQSNLCICVAAQPANPLDGSQSSGNWKAVEMLQMRINQIDRKPIQLKSHKFGE